MVVGAKFREALEPVIHLVLYAAFGAYVLSGLLLIIAGIYYLTQVIGANSFGAAVCCGVGFVMIIMGGVGILGNKQRNWMLLMIKLFLDVLLFVLLCGAFMVSMAMLNGVTDPVSKAVHETYCDDPAESLNCERESGWEPDNAGIIARQNAWAIIVGLFDQGAPVSCKDYNEELIRTELNFSPSAVEDTSASWTATGESVLRAQCTTVDDCVVEGSAAGNCTFIGEAQGAAARVTCGQCWEAWQLYKIDKIQENLWPATISVWSLFTFVMILWVLNTAVIDTFTEEAVEEGKTGGPVAILALVFNGVVFLFGAVTVGMGVYAHSELTDGCPDDKDCTNYAVVGIIIIGLFFMLTAMISLAANYVLTHKGGPLAMVMRLVLRICNLVMWFLAIALMIIGVAFTIVAGGMEDINSTYDTHFEDLRTQYESEFPGICEDLNDDQCRAKLREKTEDAALTIVIVVGIVLAGYIFILYMTYQAVHIYRGLENELDDDSDDE